MLGNIVIRLENDNARCVNAIVIVQRISLMAMRYIKGIPHLSIVQARI